MPDFAIKEWNETNFDVNSHPWLKEMYAHGRYAFASDYMRLHILAEQGGIYLDTDVEVNRSLDPFLSERCFFSFEFDSFLSTCLVGCEPGHPMIQAVLDRFDDMKGYEVNNTYWTRHMIEHYPEFRLNNRDQVIGEGIRILPKEYFVVPSFRSSENYSRHHAQGSWRADRKRSPWTQWVRRIVGEVVFYKLINIRMNWNSEFKRMEKARRRSAS
ncbi:MAG: mannosyltransferase [Flavobacteriales bacterium]|nr:mannosyltransferase [Flavobacteriales bacterium]